jgi:hypothetical protein
MDTYAAVQRLQAHGLTLAQAEAIVAVVQDALAPVPTQPELRTFVLEHDRNLERLRSEMHQEFSRLRSELLQEFGRVHTALEALRQRGA